MAMDWLQIALQNPIENWSVWFVIGIVCLNVVEIGAKILKQFFAVQRDNVVLMRDMQRNTESDNSLQTRLIEEMTARRVSDDQHKKRLADLIDDKLIRIDGTTQDTNKEIRRTQLALKALFLELKRQGVLR